MKFIKSHPGLHEDIIPTSFSELIENVFKDSDAKNTNESVLILLPKVDISQSEHKHYPSFQLAGISKENIKNDFQDGRLTSSGERKFDQKEEGRKFHKIETQYGSSLVLLEKTNHGAINAEYNDSIFNIVIPKDKKKIMKASISVK